MNFYKHHLGDYAAATSHLSWDEDCAYRRLIDQYYKREVPLPADLKEVCRLARASTPAQRRAVDVVLREFFTLEDDGWHQKRCDSEIGAANAQADTNRRIAEEREAKRRQRTEHESSNAPLHDSLPLRAESVNLARLQTPDSRLQTPDKDKGAGTREVVPRTPGADACFRMKAAGLQAVNPSHPKLLALLEAGISIDELAEAAADAAGKGKPFAYALATAEGRRRDAATAALPGKASITTPGPSGPDPTLVRMDVERAAWRPPAPEVKAMLAETAKRLKGATA